MSSVLQLDVTLSVRSPSFNLPRVERSSFADASPVFIRQLKLPAHIYNDNLRSICRCIAVLFRLLLNTARFFYVMTSVFISRQWRRAWNDYGCVDHVRIFCLHLTCGCILLHRVVELVSRLGSLSLTGVLRAVTYAGANKHLHRSC